MYSKTSVKQPPLDKNLKSLNALQALCAGLFWVVFMLQTLMREVYFYMHKNAQGKFMCTFTGFTAH